MSSVSASQNGNAAAANNGGTSIKLMSENERWLLVAAFKHLKGKFEVDWDAVAAESDCPYKNKGSITVTFGRIKREKLGLGSGAGADTPGSRKKTVGSGTNLTPSKVTKSGGNRKKNGVLPSTETDTPVRRNLAAEFEHAKLESEDEHVAKKVTRGRKIKYEESSEGRGSDTESGADPNFLIKADDSEDEFMDAV